MELKDDRGRGTQSVKERGKGEIVGQEPLPTFYLKPWG